MKSSYIIITKDKEIFSFDNLSDAVSAAEEQGSNVIIAKVVAVTSVKVNVVGINNRKLKVKKQAKEEIEGAFCDNDDNPAAVRNSRGGYYCSSCIKKASAK